MSLITFVKSKSLHHLFSSVPSDPFIGMMMTISPERDLDTLVEDPQAPPTNGFRSLDSDCGTSDMEMGSNSTNPFRTCQPPSFEEILANSGLRLSDLAVVSIPNR